MLLLARSRPWAALQKRPRFAAFQIPRFIVGYNPEMSPSSAMHSGFRALPAFLSSSSWATKMRRRPESRVRRWPRFMMTQTAS
jgi:hypothetical protein